VVGRFGLGAGHGANDMAVFVENLEDFRGVRMHEISITDTAKGVRGG
jgi:hypothetical protein